jgi:hypothetical protein
MWCELVFSKREHRMKKPFKEELLDQLLKKRLMNKALDAGLDDSFGLRPARGEAGGQRAKRA